MEAQNYCVKWKTQMQHLHNALNSYIDHQVFCDVTLASNGEVFNAHQFVLSACSPYFKNIFSNIPMNKHPIIFLPNISSLEIKTLFDYMYKGQAVVSNDLLPTFLKTCNILQIQGLCQPAYDTSQNTDRNTNNGNNVYSKKKNKSQATNIENNLQLRPENIVGNKDLQFESDNLNQEMTSLNRKKRKPNNLETSPEDNLQIIHENIQPLQSSFQMNEGREAVHTVLVNADNLSQEKKRKSKQSQYTSFKQMKPNKNVTLKKSVHKLLFPQKDVSIRSPLAIYNVNVTPSQDKSTDTMDNSEYLGLSDNESTQVGEPMNMNKNISKEVNEDHFDTTTGHSNILHSPPYSEESFIFNVNDLNTSKSSNGKTHCTTFSVSTQSIIIHDSQSDVIDISDNEDIFMNNEQNTEVTRENKNYQTNTVTNEQSNNINTSGKMVPLDVNIHNDISVDDLPLTLSPKNVHDTWKPLRDSQNDTSEDDFRLTLSSDSLHDPQESQSDESEIIIRHKTRNLSSSYNSNKGTLVIPFKEASENEECANKKQQITLSDNENLRAEALNRGRNMRIVINKNIFGDEFNKNKQGNIDLMTLQNISNLDNTEEKENQSQHLSSNEDVDKQNVQLQSHNQPSTSLMKTANTGTKGPENQELPNTGDLASDVVLIPQKKVSELPSDESCTKSTSFFRSESSSNQFEQHRNKSVKNSEAFKKSQHQHKTAEVLELKSKLRQLRSRTSSLNEDDIFISGIYESLATVPNKMKNLYCKFCKKCVRQDVFQQHMNDHAPKVEYELRNRKNKAS